MTHDQTDSARSIEKTVDQPSSQIQNTDWNLLFGIIAVQMNFVTRDHFLSAMKASSANDARPLGEILVATGAMTVEHHKMLEALINALLQQHENDLHKCLDALSSISSIREDLDQLQDPELTVRLQRHLSLEPASSLSVHKESETSDSSKLRFKIIRPHAKGGLGEVSVALDQELNREVALKEIQKKYLGDPASRERFLQEAEITGGLQHPGIVPVYGLGTFPDGSPFYAMRFIRGHSLKDAIDSHHKANQQRQTIPSEKRLELRELLGRFIDVCQAIQYAHSRGVLHRDLKPGNIMLGKYGETLVVDWGLAKVLGHQEIQSEESLLVPSSSISSSGKTRPGSALGTPAYMSPEQAAGKLDELGPETDVYSLGATLYHLLTGQSPFDGKIHEVIDKVQKGELVHPRDIASSVPPALAAICLKAMAHNPQQRYSSPQQIADDIERWLADEPVSAYSDTWSDQLSRLERKHRAWFRAGLVSASLIAILALISTLWINAERKRTDKYARSEELAKNNALNAKKTAEEKELESRRRLYIGNMNFARHAWEEARLFQLTQILEKTAPGTYADQCRDFEWYYWDRKAKEELKTLQGHASGVHSVTFSPDGKQLATAGGDSTARVWNVSTGQEIVTLQGHTSYLQTVAYSQDGSLLATAGGDKTIKLWNPSTGQLIRTLIGHSNEVSQVAFSQDGMRLASSSRDILSFPNKDITVKIWNVLTGNEIITLSGYTDGVLDIEFSPDDRIIAAAGGDGQITLWNATTYEKITSFKCHPYAIFDIAFSPDGAQIASASADRTIKIWNTKTYEEVKTFQGHLGAVSDVVFTPNGHQIVSGSVDRTIKVWDVVTGSELVSFASASNAPMGGATLGVAVSPDGSRIASAGDDGTVKLWDASLTFNSIVGKGHTQSVNCVACSPDNSRIVTGGQDELVKIWDASTGIELATLKGYPGSVRAVAFSPDGSMIAAAGMDTRRNPVRRDHSIKIWNSTTYQEIATLSGHERFIDDISFSPDSQRIASASNDMTARVWDVAKAKQICLFKGHNKLVMSVAFSPDGNRVASGGDDKTARLWDARTGQELMTFNGHEAVVSALQFSKDGTLLATGSWDSTIKLWDPISGQELKTLTGHAGFINSLEFNPVGTRLAAASTDGTIKLWDISTGEETLLLKKFHQKATSPKFVNEVAFSPDGTRLFSAHMDNSLVIWDARPWTDELRLQQQAMCLLNSVFQPKSTREKVFHAIESNQTFIEPVKQLALKMASSLPLGSLQKASEARK
ncbi:Serine/threonine protein kinase-related protein [Planctopirus limnophila DSM 3776]|uniref:Serine/threonine protein kinase-related protein n=1 Tax=Planctopirus limnophila (strain ATCC 43296 / DSM 3776 / IFAM 1008 / Mu 290) TaxID=521674 RepID=D5SUY3_PLAL2|nr:protein kinase [Planctopirus limnophila]ADG69269.1 Serine/threonine protein kinase-related protein [Planctopirus limnophila DSM 3776]